MINVKIIIRIAASYCSTVVVVVVHTYVLFASCNAKQGLKHVSAGEISVYYGFEHVLWLLLTKLTSSPSFVNLHVP